MWRLLRNNDGREGLCPNIIEWNSCWRADRCLTSRRSLSVVSFLHIPAYIEDDHLIDKLESFKVTVLSPVQRRYYPGTEIADGTRFVNVRLPPNLLSIPYSVKLDNVYYRVVHDNQKRMCGLGHSLEHLFKDCPDFIRFRCKGRGHYAVRPHAIAVVQRDITARVTRPIQYHCAICVAHLTVPV